MHLAIKRFRNESWHNTQPEASCQLRFLDMVSKVVLYGATGEIGPYLAKAIAQKGHDTTAVVRAATKQANSKKIDALKAAAVKIVEGDLDVSEAELVAFLRNFEVVVSAVSSKTCSHLLPASILQNISELF